MRSQILGLACLALAILPAKAQAVPVAAAIPQVQVLPILNRWAAVYDESGLRRLPMTHDELRRNRPTIAAGLRCPWFMRLAELAAFRHSVAAGAATAQKDIIPRRRERMD